MTNEYGPFDRERARNLRDYLDRWCHQSGTLTVELGMFDVCEAVIPALDAMLRRPKARSKEKAS